MALRQTAAPNLPKTEDVIRFERRLAGDLGRFFEPGREIVVARAPARLDAMGGIADYSGSVVCELTLQEAAVLAVQRRTDRRIRVHSEGIEREGLTPEGGLVLDDFLSNGRMKSYEEVGAMFRRDPGTSWMGYIAGAFYVLMREGGSERFPEGATVVLSSEVPMGSGISSSASIEVAAMCAIAEAYDLGVDGLELARLAQIVENRVVGAPCGIMDQITSALGEQDAPIVLRCRPYEVLGTVELADDCRLVGVNSKVRHQVGGSKYTDVRIGAFMGLTILLNELRSMGRIGEGEDPFDGYLCAITPEEFALAYRDRLPTSMKGDAFLARYGETPDPVTRVDPERTYLIRSRAEHPVYENARVQAFVRDLEAYRRTGEREFIRRAGRRMYASHWSYGNRCGLGSPETDRIVRLVRGIGEEGGLYGAKITGGGSGGTVAVLGLGDIEEPIGRIVERYEAATGICPDVFRGSSPGALAFGHVRYVL